MHVVLISQIGNAKQTLNIFRCQCYLNTQTRQWDTARLPLGPLLNLKRSRIRGFCR